MHNKESIKNQKVIPRLKDPVLNSIQVSLSLPFSPHKLSALSYFTTFAIAAKSHCLYSFAAIASEVTKWSFKREVATCSQMHRQSHHGQRWPEALCLNQSPSKMLFHELSLPNQGYHTSWVYLAKPKYFCKNCSVRIIMWYQKMQHGQSPPKTHRLLKTFCLAPLPIPVFPVYTCPRGLQ